MLRIIIPLFTASFSFLVSGQETASLEKQQEIVEMRVDKNFNAKYNRQLRLLKRTYPMALKAKALIDEYEADLSEIEKNRQKKKYGREAHSDLKDEFVFNIRDLYSSEGDLLMKLVYRETGMTVNEIIKKYRGGVQNSLYSGLAMLWGQNLNDTYDANGDDWITELVIQDIESGRISFDKEMKKLNKEGYKESMADYRQSKKDIREVYKKRKKEKKQSKNK
jgi:hypothetical protein